MEKWHDPTGVILLVGCFLCLWGVAVWLAQAKEKIETLKMEGGDQKAEVSVSVLALCLLFWAMAVEVSTEAWFRSHEVRGGQSVAWSARWPTANSTLQTNTIPQNALRILQCDEHASASWTGDDGIFWQAFYLRWFPADSFYGRTKEALSKSHNPAECLTGAGMKLQARLNPVLLPVRPGLNLWFDRYVFAADDREMFVFFSQTEDLTDNDTFSLRTTPLARLRAALAGSRNYGQNNFEVAVTGPETAAAALRSFTARLPELIEIQSASSLPGK